MVAWTPEERPCPICASESYRVLGARGGAAHRDGLGAQTTVVRCRDCTTTYARPFMIPASNPYAESTSDEYFANHDEAAKIAMGEALADRTAAVLGRTGVALEIGCGRGEVLEGFRRRGWDVRGVEMTEGFAAVARRRGVELEIAAAETSRFLEAPESVDAILFAAILEHLYDPVAILRKAHRALRPGGVVFIDVPNEAALSLAVGNLYMKLRRRDWAINLSPTFPPFHVVGFTPKSLRYALEKNGFEVVALSVPQYSNTLPPGESLGRRIEHAALGAILALGARFGKGDGLVCWARKR